MDQQSPSIHDGWIKHQRSAQKSSISWACAYCLDRKVFSTRNDLWSHALTIHAEDLPASRAEDENLSARRRRPEDGSLPGRPAFDEASGGQRMLHVHKPRHRPPLVVITDLAKDYDDLAAMVLVKELHRLGVLQLRGFVANLMPPSQIKGSLSDPSYLNLDPFRSRPTLADLHIESDGEHLTTRDIGNGNHIVWRRKGAAIGDGISAGTASFLPLGHPDPPPRGRKVPIPASNGCPSESEMQKPSTIESSLDRTQGIKKLWTPDRACPSIRASSESAMDPQKMRKQDLYLQSRKPGRAVSQRSSQPQCGRNPISSAFHGRKTTGAHPSSSEDEVDDILLQPETPPISHEQLVAEVKGIYAGLVMVETKCIEVDNRQASLAVTNHKSRPNLNDEQWQALIALHRTLLHEHHDFFLTSLHPSADSIPRGLASKYALPARMWRHGIHSFLELLRHRIPDSLEHMLAFIYLAYSMMALLYETVPAFEETWIKCVGDLGRYRMAIEDDDVKDREVWTGLAQHWYSKASDKIPTHGRLYHHLAILGRPNALQQLYYYSKSLCSDVPFTSARESILDLFNPVLNEVKLGQYRFPLLDTAFLKAHGLIITGRVPKRFKTSAEKLFDLSDNGIGRVTSKFMEQGYYHAAAESTVRLDIASNYNPHFRGLAINKAQEASGQDLQCLKTSETLQSLSDRDSQGTAYSSESSEGPNCQTPSPCDQSLLHKPPNICLLELGPLHVLQRFPGYNLKSDHQTLSESLPHRYLNTLSTIGSSLSRKMARIVTSPLKTLVFAGLLPTVKALSTQSPSYHVDGSEHRWTAYIRTLAAKQFDPEFLVKCVVLLASSLLILRYDEDRLLFIAASILGAVYMGSDDRVTNSELVPVCVSSALLIIHYHSKKLAPFSKTSAATGTLILMFAMLSTEVFRRSSSLGGRYENPWIFHMVADLLAVMITGWLWEAFVLRLGFAKSFEDAFLDWPAIQDMDGHEMIYEIFPEDEVTARYHSWRDEKARQKRQTRV